MSSVNQIDLGITREYQRVVLLATLLHEHQADNKEEGMYSVHLLVRAFARVLGDPFVVCDGEVINLSRGESYEHGTSIDIRFATTREVVGGRACIIPHSWLLIPDSNVIIDVLPPGADSRDVIPVKYMPNPYRPAYTKKAFKESSVPHHSDVIDLSKLLRDLEKKGLPMY